MKIRINSLRTIRFFSLLTLALPALCTGLALSEETITIDGSNSSELTPYNEHNGATHLIEQSAYMGIDIKSDGYYEGVDVIYQTITGSIHAGHGIFNNTGHLNLKDVTAIMSARDKQKFLKNNNGGVAVIDGLTIEIDDIGEGSHRIIENDGGGMIQLDNFTLRINHNNPTVSHQHSIVNYTGGTINGKGWDITYSPTSSQDAKIILNQGTMIAEDVRVVVDTTGDPYMGTETAFSLSAIRTEAGGRTSIKNFTADMTIKDAEKPGQIQGILVNDGCVAEFIGASVTIDANANVIVGASTRSGSSLYMTDASISITNLVTPSSYSDGAAAFSLSSYAQVELEGTNSANVNAVGAYGIVTLGGSLHAAHLDITMSEISSHAIQAVRYNSADPDVVVNGGVITVKNASAYAVNATSGGNITLGGVDINTAGSAFNIGSAHFDLNNAGNVNVKGDLIRVAGSGGSATIKNTAHVEQTGNLLTVASGTSGLFDFTIINSTLSGNIMGRTSASSLALNVTLGAGAIYDGLINQRSSFINVAMSSGSMWEVAESATINQLTLDGGANLLFNAAGQGNFTDILAASVMLASGSFLTLDFAEGYDAALELVGNEIVLFRADGSFIDFDNGSGYGNALLQTADGFLLIYERGSAGDGSFVITAVAHAIPEPAGATLGFAGLALLMLRRRKH